MRVARPERRDYGTVNHTINISLAPGRIARMKIVGHRIDEEDSDVRREIAVDGVTKFLRTHFALQKHAGYLSFGVHAGIGAARSMNRNIATIKQRSDRPNIQPRQRHARHAYAGFAPGAIN